MGFDLFGALDLSIAVSVITGGSTFIVFSLLVDPLTTGDVAPEVTPEAKVVRGTDKILFKLFLSLDDDDDGEKEDDDGEKEDDDDTVRDRLFFESEGSRVATSLLFISPSFLLLDNALELIDFSS